MSAMKTPGVYVVEKNAFPNSVVEVATAVPAFIGYTEKAINGTKSLTNTPWRISSLAEFVQYFGAAPKPVFSFKALASGTSFIAVDANPALKAAKSETKSLQDTIKTANDDATEATKITADTKATADAKAAADAKAKNSLKAAVAAASSFSVVVNDLLLSLKAAAFADSAALTAANTAFSGILFDTTGTPLATTPTAADLKAKTDALVTAINAVSGTALKANDATAETVTDEETAAGDKPKPAAAPATTTPIATKYYSVSRTDVYSLYYNMRFFFANGGGPCYVVSVGSYTDDLSGEKLTNGIDPLLKEQEPTMVLVPEAVNLDSAQACYDVQTAVLKHCGLNMNRVAILDVYDGYKDRKDPNGDVVISFREKIGTDFLDYASAYYPWLNTSIVPDNELSFINIDPADVDTFKNVILGTTPRLYAFANKIGTIGADNDTNHKVLYKQSPLYATIVKDMAEQVNLLPPSAAMAGIYTLTDQTKEVWKAPANTGMSNVISTTVNISYADQEDLNVPFDGKAINAIRYFTGEGIKVWGARTLDGNSLDWRYINVRRTMIMLEESIKNAAKAFVFDPNVANTWVIVRSTITNFLTGIWKRGGLAGAVPEDAFSVHVGLGETMTPDDILEGKMLITVLVAISRPAEFIEITFMQQMQKS